MAKPQSSQQKAAKPRKRPPATTPEARENQLIALAVDQAEKQLIDGTASSQVLTHFLKLATVREGLEREKLALERDLIKAKTESLQSSEDIKALYAEAMSAFRQYSGLGDGEMND